MNCTLNLLAVLAAVIFAQKQSRNLKKQTGLNGIRNIDPGIPVQCIHALVNGQLYLFTGADDCDFDYDMNFATGQMTNRGVVRISVVVRNWVDSKQQHWVFR